MFVQRNDFKDGTFFNFKKVYPAFGLVPSTAAPNLLFRQAYKYAPIAKQHKISYVVDESAFALLAAEVKTNTDAVIKATSADPITPHPSGPPTPVTPVTPVVPTPIAPADFPNPMPLGPDGKALLVPNYGKFYMVGLN